MKYKNKDGIELNYDGMSEEGRKGSGGDLVQEVIREAIKIGFRDGGIRKFIASIDSLNIASLNAYLNGGFQIESKIKKYFFWSKGVEKLFL